MGGAPNHQVDKPGNPTDVSQTLCFQNGHMNAAAMMTETGGYSWTQGHGLSLNKAGLATTWLNHQPLGNRDRLWVWYSTIPQENQEDA